jgi:hypothetical protein
MAKTKVFEASFSNFKATGPVIAYTKLCNSLRCKELAYLIIICYTEK